MKQEEIAKKIAISYNNFLKKSYKNNGYLIYNVNDGTGGYWVDNINEVNTRNNFISMNVNDKSSPVTIEDVLSYIELKFG